MSYKGKDGLERDIAKMADEWKILKQGMKEHLKRHKKDQDGHSYTNLWVEAQRLSPYFMGHIDAFYYPASILAIAGLAIWLYCEMH